MPQITLELTANIIEKNNINAVLKKIHAILTSTLPTDIQTCKSRAFICEHFLVGTGDVDMAFIHCTLKIMRGRTPQIQKETGERVLSVLREEYAESLQKFRLQITVEVLELGDTYLKFAS
jgi:5-carboxymethyl-2-hydroxymuconate isomerase